MNQRVAILDGIRTPFCKAGGAFKTVPADDLGAIALEEILARLDIEPDEIDEVIFGNVAQPIHAANVARIIALKAGIPNHVPALTVHRNCASGMESITNAASQILSGRSNLVVAGGTECMSQIPLIFSEKMTNMFIRLVSARTLGQRLKAIASFRPSFLKPIIALKLGLSDPICGLNMGETAEILARRFGITRNDQDEFAKLSHNRAIEAAEAGHLAEEITPVIAPPKYCSATLKDDGPRANQSMEALAKLRPYFNRQAGTVTVGNACPITDGAAVLILASEDKAAELGIKPIGYLNDWAYAALEGEAMGLGPAYATAKLFAQSDYKLADFDLIELNEAFAAQVIANERAFSSRDFAKKNLNRDSALGELNREKLNVNGGAIAYGHPVGATGTRLVLTVLKELRRRNQKNGLATLCVGGGQGAALALEAA